MGIKTKNVINCDQCGEDLEGTPEKTDSFVMVVSAFRQTDAGETLEATPALTENLVFCDTKCLSKYTATKFRGPQPRRS